MSRISPRFPQSKKESIWIHAVSVGEVRSLEMLLVELKKKYNNIYLSVTTPSGYKYAREKYNFINVINAPLDFSFIIKKFICRIKPKIMILNELEIWPNWIHILNKQQIKVVLINGRISQKAFKKYSFFKFLLSPIFKRISLFMIQSEFYVENFLNLKIPRKKIIISGNIKADQAETYLNRVLTPDKVFSKLRVSPPKKRIIVAASTHPEDEQILIPALNKLLDKYSLILVPRHPKRSNLIQGELGQSGLSSLKWKDGGTADLNKNILIFDEIGFLFSIMSIADIVIMGGTFSKKIGGHNFYEPLALNKPIFGGPYYNNFPDIGGELEKTGLYKIYSNSKQLVQTLNDYKTTKLGSNHFQEIFNKRKGTVSCTIKEIEKILS